MLGPSIVTTRHYDNSVMCFRVPVGYSLQRYLRDWNQPERERWIAAILIEGGGKDLKTGSWESGSPSISFRRLKENLDISHVRCQRARTELC